MIDVDGATPLIGERGAVTLLDAFEGRISDDTGTPFSLIVIPVDDKMAIKAQR